MKNPATTQKIARPSAARSIQIPNTTAGAAGDVGHAREQHHRPCVGHALVGGVLRRPVGLGQVQHAEAQEDQGEEDSSQQEDLVTHRAPLGSAGQVDPPGSRCSDRRSGRRRSRSGRPAPRRGGREGRRSGRAGRTRASSDGRSRSASTAPQTPAPLSGSVRPSTAGWVRPIASNRARWSPNVPFSRASANSTGVRGSPSL